MPNAFRITGHCSLSVGTTPKKIELGQNFPNGVYVICPTANAGSVYIGDGSVSSSYPPVPKSDTFADALFIPASMVNAGNQTQHSPVYLLGSQAGQIVYFYPG